MKFWLSKCFLQIFPLSVNHHFYVLRRLVEFTVYFVIDLPLHIYSKVWLVSISLYIQSQISLIFLCRKLQSLEDQEIRNGGVKLGENAEQKKKPGCC